MPNSSNSKIFFHDRQDAADQLIDEIPIETFRQQIVTVVAVSQGGVEIADRVAQAIESPMDILLSEPIPAPNNHELPIAMISETQTMVKNQVLIDAFGIDEDYLYNEAKRRYDEQVLSYVYRYRHGDPIRSVERRVVVLVDDCVETGITTLVAIKSMLEQGATNVYVAVPILDASVRDNLVQVCDGVYCAHTIRDYISIEYYYEHLETPTFEFIERILKQYE